MVCLPVEIGRLSIFYLRSVQFYPNTSMFLASSEGINGLSALFVKESDTKFAMEWWWVRFIQHSASSSSSSSSSCCFRLQTPGRNLESKKGNLENTTSVSKRQQTSVSPSVDRFDLPKPAPCTRNKPINQNPKSNDATAVNDIKTGYSLQILFYCSCNTIDS